ncbi:hypothetical protein [Dinghuibacter silviterrae]|uniref:Curli production assembly/transport component CsgG n=1 Tax=Dinghuibacter silviterrae TaxID=1539049 RepID=A0A4R8DW38_9BACT|nr:hypothetical protein [Dinghuibacter silviterrae]TDX02286.1 hypothetical protein EDB95_3341 [Dinghuibacter silviterrae]
MNKPILFICLLSLSVTALRAQTGAPPAQTLKGFFANEAAKTVWLGLDFSQTRWINDPASTPQAMANNVFPALNNLIVKEVKRYNVGEAFHHVNMDHDFTGVEENYGKLAVDSLHSTNSDDATRLKEADIRRIVSGLNMGNRTGYGVLLVVEGLDKTGKRVTTWATIVDMGTRTVLFTRRVEGKVGEAFGERNYWAAGIRNILDGIKDRFYKEWKKKYS